MFEAAAAASAAAQPVSDTTGPTGAGNPPSTSWLQQQVMQQLEEKKAITAKLAAEAAEKERALAAQTWYNRTWHYMSDTSWGAALVLFVVLFIILCIARPAFVCNRPATPYQTQPLDVVRALVYSAIGTGLFLILCYTFNCL